MKRYRSVRILAACALCLFLALGLAEFSVRLLVKVSPEEREALSRKALAWPLDAYPQTSGPLMANHLAHPFWGSSANPDAEGVNNFGFQEPDDYPYVRRPGEVVVGLLGASVASQVKFALEDRLEEVAGKGLMPGCPTKVRVRNFALGSLRQPSQFHIFSYFSGDFDVAVNLDGYNEAFLAPVGLPATYPTLSHELFFTSDEKLTRLRRAYRYTGLQFHLANSARDNLLVKKSDLAFLFARGFFDLFQRRKTEIMESIRADFRRPDMTAQDEIEEGAATWAKYIRLQEALSRNLGKKSFFFLQPSQYAPEGKEFSPAEQALMGQSDDPDMLGNLRRGIISLRELAAQLRREGVDITDLTAMFSKETDTIFIDTCCHLNQKGNEILARVIVDRLLPYLRQRYCNKSGFRP